MNKEIKPLSKRELQVADLTLKGLTYTQIGEELELSPNTIKTHRQNLYTKLGINSRRELFTMRREQGAGSNEVKG